MCVARAGPEPETGEREWCEEQGDCQQLCYLSAGRQLCDCYPGYSLASDNVTCQDIDECLAHNGGCDQICHNRPGTFMCEVSPVQCRIDRDLSSLLNIDPDSHK